VKEIYLYEEQPPITPNVKSCKELQKDVNFGQFAFAFDKAEGNLTDVEMELIKKISDSVNQTIENTLLMDISLYDFSVSALKAMEIKCLVIFSDEIPTIFDSFSVKHHMPFLISGLKIFITQSIDGFSQNAESKKVVWGFMKSNI
jgi:hypothetical protein